MMMWRSYLGSNVTSIRNIIFLDVKVATFFVPRNDPCDLPRRSSSDIMSCFCSHTILPLPQQ